MSEPVSPPPPGPPPAQASSNQPMIALILGIVGIVCCQLTAPVAWYLGKQELAAIAAGRSPASGEGTARAGMILGIIGSVFLIFGLLWVLFFGGLGFIQAMSEM